MKRSFKSCSFTFDASWDTDSSEGKKVGRLVGGGDGDGESLLRTGFIVAGSTDLDAAGAVILPLILDGASSSDELEDDDDEDESESESDSDSELAAGGGFVTIVGFVVLPSSLESLESDEDEEDEDEDAALLFLFLFLRRCVAGLAGGGGMMVVD